MGTGRQAYHKPRQARREEKKWIGRDKKKRCGFIMVVIESAAAGCDIPNDSWQESFSGWLCLP